MINWTNLNMENITEIEGINSKMIILDQIIKGTSLIKENWVSQVLVRVGHYVTYVSLIYEVIEIVSVNKLEGGNMVDKVGLIVKEVKT